MAYDAGESWHLTDEKLIALQRDSTTDRYETDAWQAPIEAFIAPLHLTTSGEIAKGALAMDVKDVNVTHTRRIGKVMHILGWENQSIRRDGPKSKTVRCYVLPEAKRVANSETDAERAASLKDLMHDDADDA